VSVKPVGFFPEPVDAVQLDVEMTVPPSRPKLSWVEPADGAVVVSTDPVGHPVANELIFAITNPGRAPLVGKDWDPAAPLPTLHLRLAAGTREEADDKLATADRLAQLKVSVTSPYLNLWNVDPVPDGWAITPNPERSDQAVLDPEHHPSVEVQIADLVCDLPLAADAGPEVTPLTVGWSNIPGLAPDQDTLTITKIPGVLIRTFTADPAWVALTELRTPVTLSWTVDHADRIDIDQDARLAAPGAHTATAHPHRSTRYQLTARGRVGQRENEATASVPVVVYGVTGWVQLQYSPEVHAQYTSQTQPYPRPETFVVSPDGRTIFALADRSRSVLGIDPATNTVQWVCPGRFAMSIASGPESDRVLTTAAGYVSMIGVPTSYAPGGRYAGWGPFLNDGLGFPRWARGVARTTGARYTLTFEDQGKGLAVLMDPTGPVPRTDVPLPEVPSAIVAAQTLTYALHRRDGRVVVSALRRGATRPVATTEVGDGEPAGLLVLSADEQHLYATSTLAGHPVLQVLDCHDPDRLPVSATVRLDHPPTGLATDAYGNSVYLLTPNADREKLVVLDTATNTLTGHVDLGPGPGGIAVARAADTIYRCHYPTGALTTMRILS
jgi:hypothetical protein